MRFGQPTKSEGFGILDKFRCLLSGSCGASADVCSTSKRRSPGTVILTMFRSMLRPERLFKETQDENPDFSATRDIP
jgi:hypothetical protein